LTEVIHGSARLIYHIAVVGLSAAFVLSLPLTVSFAAKKFLAYWSLIGNDKIFDLCRNGIDDTPHPSLKYHP
jgi:hypothetical protein